MTSRRKITGTAADVVDSGGLPPAPPPEFVGFRPTPFQSRARAQFWAAVRDDPFVDPRSATGVEVARLLDEPRVETWFRDPTFVAWFRKEDAWRAHADWLADLWLERAFDVLMHPLLEPAQFIALGRELAKMSGRAMPPTGPTGGSTPAAMTHEQARVLIEKQAKSMGWLPPPPPAPAAESEQTAAPEPTSE
jgi:hypothetical protein